MHPTCTNGLRQRSGICADKSIKGTKLRRQNERVGLHGWLGAVGCCEDGGPLAIDACARVSIERNHPIVLQAQRAIVSRGGLAVRHIAQAPTATTHQTPVRRKKVWTAAISQSPGGQPTCAKTRHARGVPVAARKEGRGAEGRFNKCGRTLRSAT